MNTEVILKELVGIPSFVEGNKPLGEVKVANYLIRYFKDIFPHFKIYKIPLDKARENLVFLGSSKPKFLVACHMDTVLPSSSKQLQLKISGVKAIGLGTKDMKGGIVATIKMLEFKEKYDDLGIIFYGDEEYSQKGIIAVSEKLPFILKKKPQLIISPESRFNLGYGARGIIVIALTIKGKTAHSARPELGVDAVKGVYKLLRELEKKFERPTKLGSTIFTLTRIIGGTASPLGSIDNRVGSIPDTVEVSLSVRNSRASLDANKLITIMEEIAKKNNLTIQSAKVISDFPARITPKSVIALLQKKVYKKYNLSLELANPKNAGYNDAAILGKALGCPVVNFGPYGEANHTKDEWVSLESIDETAKILDAICT